MGLIRHDEVQTKEYEPGLFGIKLIDGARGATHVSLLRGWLKPNSQHAPHTHDVEEAIIFLSGRGVQSIGDQRYDVGPGDSVLVPPGIIHSTLNTGQEDLVFVAAYPDNVITAQPAPAGSVESSPPSSFTLRHRMAWVLRQVAARLSPRVQGMRAR